MPLQAPTSSFTASIETWRPALAAASSSISITYLDTVPRRDLSPWCFAAALACVLLLLTASHWEIRAWR